MHIYVLAYRMEKLGVRLEKDCRVSIIMADPQGS